MARVRLGAAVFAPVAIVGPLIRYMTWPPLAFEQRTSERVADFVYALVFLLWPTQAFGMEVTAGRLIAAVYALGGNVLFFATLGVAVSITSTRPRMLWLSCLVLCGIIMLLAGWGAGFSSDFLDWPALGAALLIYLTPFLVLSRILRY